MTIRVLFVISAFTFIGRGGVAEQAQQNKTAVPFDSPVRSDRF
jgi:hypothetical protein